MCFIENLFDRINIKQSKFTVFRPKFQSVQTMQWIDVVKILRIKRMENDNKNMHPQKKKNRKKQLCAFTWAIYSVALIWAANRFTSTVFRKDFNAFAGVK